MTKTMSDITGCSKCNIKFNGFETLNEDELNAFKESHCKVVYQKGETIIKEGTRCNNIICIKKGYAKLFIKGLENKNIIIKVLKEGDFIVSPGLFTDNLNHFSVSALTEMDTCLISVEAFTNAFRNNICFAEQILKLNHQITTDLYHQLINFSHKKMTGRIANTILYLSEKIYHSRNFYTTLSRQDIADLSSVSKESLIRVLKDFKESGIISINGNQIEINSPKTLENISRVG
ncbi:Crp/Fnr family transcriptional regulator [Carboxylicivirga sediminis]|uniref:Crp/Fnr family transcriptional regulator n=1 Tax=Carboxylicivirga sediminis TaxID=2006564 RepID=A0A941IXM9_9BACT|nr:Crp/Fnr family transcriptional regulator [Carboxylicivirga sediminis]MBR8536235.1 Crp/Fnr family transcriptional regulator [Carboxylicivirga sediminis]